MGEGVLTIEIFFDDTGGGRTREGNRSQVHPREKPWFSNKSLRRIAKREGKEMMVTNTADRVQKTLAEGQANPFEGRGFLKRGVGGGENVC